MITRRCLDRRFYLLPSPIVNRIFLYALALCARMFGVDIHASIVMSNHYHLILTDVLGNLPDFMHRLNLLVSRALIAHRGIRGSVFENGSYNLVVLETPEAVLDKMAYVSLNPVTARLVKRSYQWEGVSTLPEHLGTVVESRITRPNVYFKPRPDEKPLQLRLTIPPCLSHMTREGVVAAVHQRVEERTLLLTGPALGMKKVLRSRFTDRPATEEKPGSLVPAFAALSRSAWRRAKQRLRDFHHAYRMAFRRFQKDGSIAGFPPGTWWMAKHCGALSSVCIT